MIKVQVTDGYVVEYQTFYKVEPRIPDQGPNLYDVAIFNQV